MPTLNPSSVNFTHKKGDALPPGFLISHDYSQEIIDLPPALNWLDIYDITDFNFKVRLNFNVNNIVAGNYAEVLTISTEENESEEHPLHSLRTQLYIALNLIDTQDLSVSPSSGGFSFIIGGAAPIGKTFSILSENPWTIAKNASWLNLSTAAGSGNGSFIVSVNITGLAPGVYNDTVTVSESGDSYDIAISLTVSDPNTGSDYLNIYPQDLTFGLTVSGIAPADKNTDINASAVYSVTASEPWIKISAASGAAGNSVLAIGLQNFGALTPGLYVGYVDLNIGNINKQVVVNLEVFELVSEGLNAGALYFADDENYFKVSSARADTNMSLRVITSFEGKQYNIPYSVPFFNGVASKRLGGGISNIIGDRSIFGFAEVKVFTPYLPLSANVEINEVDSLSGAIIQSINTNNIKFIKGQKPFSNLLSNMPGTMFLTKDATLIFSVLSDGFPAGNLVISGDVDLTKVNSGEILDFYTVVVPLSELTGLKDGSVFNVRLLNQSIRVVVVKPGIAQSMLYAESQWGTFEPFELTGEVIQDSGFSSKLFKQRKDHLHTEAKVFETTKAVSFKINTGYLGSDAVIDYLDKILDATNFYLQTSTGFRKVRSTTRRLQARKTLRESRMADLTFVDVLE